MDDAITSGSSKISIKKFFLGIANVHQKMEIENKRKRKFSLSNKNKKNLEEDLKNNLEYIKFNLLTNSNFEINYKTNEIYKYGDDFIEPDFFLGIPKEDLTPIILKCEKNGVNYSR
jgi:hypothetical protein